MLSNKDFANLLTSTKSEGDGKVRFDLKQISEWDKQNKAKSKNKTGGISKSDKKSDNDDDGQQKNVPRYRDRAEERRKDANPDYNLESINEIIKLDAEKTKYLGGDIDHTHLVKGLDYTLLRKVKEQLETYQRQDHNGDGKSPDSAKFEPVTEIGKRLKRIVFENETDIPKEVAGSCSRFARLAFDYSLDPFSTNELPTEIMRSKQVKYLDSS